MNDQELQIELAKMLPEKIELWSNNTLPRWKDKHGDTGIIRDTEWLHVCWLIEQEVLQTESHLIAYIKQMALLLGPQSQPANRRVVSASWQQRAAALIATKGKQ